MKRIIGTETERVEQCAAAICRVLREKPEAVLALSAGADCLPVYRRVVRCCAEEELNLANATVFLVDEFEGLSDDDARSCRNRLISALEGTGGSCTQIKALTRENLENVDREIRAAGGLDLAVLELGINARFGFNEPATPYDSRAHRQKLTPATHREYAELFGSEEQVPDYGLTLGIKTIVEAREILATASGERKAKAAFDMLYGRDDSTVPAAFLQLPFEVTVYLDKAAASKL